MKLDQLVLFDHGLQLLGSEFHVYYCNSCRLVLTILPEPLRAESTRITSSMTGSCPGCGGSLNELTLKHDRYLGHLDAPYYTDPRLNRQILLREPSCLKSDFPSRVEPETISPLVSANRYSCPTLISGANALVQGHYECARAALKGPVLFLDGGNAFHTSHLRESVGSEAVDIVKDNTIVSRAFNYHQLTSMVIEKLPDALQSYHPTTISVFEPTLLYEDDDVIDGREAWYSFKRMAWALRRISLSQPGVRVLMVVSCPETKAGQMLENICSDETVLVNPDLVP